MKSRSGGAWTLGDASVPEEGVDFAKMEPRDGRIVRHVLGSF